MVEYINREALETKLSERLTYLREKNGYYDHYTDGYDEAVDTVEDFPAANVMPVVRCRKQVEQVWRGEWELEKVGKYHHLILYHCSRCGFELPFNPREIPQYCPLCGSAMTDDAMEMVMERLEAMHDKGE